MRPGVMAPPGGATPRMRGVMAPAYEVSSPALFALDADAFRGFDLHVEARRLLWGAALVLAVVVLALQALSRSV